MKKIILLVLLFIVLSCNQYVTNDTTDTKKTAYSSMYVYQTGSNFTQMDAKNGLWEASIINASDSMFLNFSQTNPITSGTNLFGCSSHTTVT